MTYLVLIIVSWLIVSIYMVCYICVCKLPTSISATYYKTQHKWLLPTVLGLSIGSAIIPFFDLTPDYWRFLSFLTVAGIMFVCAAPAFRQEFEGKVHCCAAIVAGASSIGWLIAVSGVPWIAITGLVVAIADRKHFVFWIEAGLLINLYIVLGLLSFHTI